MDEKHDDIWALVISEGKRFLGKITSFLAPSTTTIWVDVTTDIEMRGSILGSAKVCLNPVLDFISMDQPQAAMNEKMEQVISFKKIPVILPYDYAMKGAKIYTKWSTIMFIDDLDEQDQKTYRNFIKEGLEKTGTYGPNKPMQQPLIQLASPGALPPDLQPRRNGGR